jgi:Concanavalin A-like lectin/glucanases superfamily
MKRLLGSMISSRNKKIACTVSAAALMLGVSSAATVGLHFQCNYNCGGAPAYTGFPVTMTAFGIESNGWENLTPMPNAYGGCVWTTPGYETNEVIDTESSTNGLNPLPNGSINVTWFGNCANFSGFFGYGDLSYAPPPTYGHPNHPPPNPVPSGESEVYLTFIRDGINFGPSADSADNPLKAYYSVDITGLKSLFTNTPYVIELIAASDSMYTLTNAFVTDVTNSITYSVSYASTPIPADDGGAPWLRGTGGGLSTASGAFTNANADHIHIMSNIPQHGGTGAPPTGFDHAGTISGFIITDKPVVTMSPQSIPVAGPGDTIVVSAYAIGVTPLSFQWQLNGKDIPGATTLSNTIASATLADSGSYTLIVSNAYGVATSKVATVTVDSITQSPTATNNIIFDSNPDNAQHNGLNLGATWLASGTGGTVTRDGVMSFTATNVNGITVPDNAAFDGPVGTIAFWMLSSGTDPNSSGSIGASMFYRPVASDPGAGFLILQDDTSGGGFVQFIAPGDLVNMSSSTSVSDNKWHLVALTFDQTTNGGAALYIDGTLAVTNSNGGNAYTWPAGQALEIGYDSTTNYRSYNGLLDDYRYYSAILSPSEISSIYSSGALADTADLQFQYNFTAAPGEGIVLTWLESTAVLQTASSLNGPWTDVTGATSPYTIVPAASQQYFRYRWPHTPTTVNSNPYLM